MVYLYVNEGDHTTGHLQWPKFPISSTPGHLFSFLFFSFLFFLYFKKCYMTTMVLLHPNPSRLLTAPLAALRPSAGCTESPDDTTVALALTGSVARTFLSAILMTYCPSGTEPNLFVRLFQFHLQHSLLKCQCNIFQKKISAWSRCHYVQVT